MSAWKRWDTQNSITSHFAKRRANKALQELAVLCAPEITEALNEFKGSGNILIFEPAMFVREVAGVGVLKAASTLRDKPGHSLLKHVKDCTAGVLKEAETDQREKLRRLPPEQLLDVVLSLSRPCAASILDRASFDQLSNLVVELVRRRLVNNGATISLDLENEPEDALLWLLWYIFRLHAEEAGARGLLAKGQETPTVLLVNCKGNTRTQPRNKRGEPINLAGPILVKVFDVLTGLPNNQIPAPARTNTRLGCTFNVDPDVVGRWKRHPEWHDLRVNVKPDSEGGVHYTFDLDALLRSAGIVMGCKRGPKIKPSPESSS